MSREVFITSVRPRGHRGGEPDGPRQPLCGHRTRAIPARAGRRGVRPGLAWPRGGSVPCPGALNQGRDRSSGRPGEPSEVRTALAEGASV